MSSWNRLTNGLRDELSKLSIWTTDEDRRLALSYKNPHFTKVPEAMAAVRAGQKAPANLGELIAAARYEDAGWMPDGGFDRWRRWSLGGHEQLRAAALVRWLDAIERDMQTTLRAVEKRLLQRCQASDIHARHLQEQAAVDHQILHKHYQQQILARLAVGDTEGARSIELRQQQGAPAGPTLQEAFRHLHATSERAPDVRGTAMRLVRQDAFATCMAAVQTLPSPPSRQED